MDKIFKVLYSFVSLSDWDAIHISVTTKSGKNEIYVTNPDAIVESQPASDEGEIIEPVRAPETLGEKIERFRTAPMGALTAAEEAWWKERQKELVDKQIGQITSELPIEEAIRRFNELGIQ